MVVYVGPSGQVQGIKIKFKEGPGPFVEYGVSSLAVTLFFAKFNEEITKFNEGNATFNEGRPFVEYDFVVVFRARGSRSRVQGSSFRLPGLGIKAWGSGSKVQSLGIPGPRVPTIGFKGYSGVVSQGESPATVRRLGCKV